MIYKQIISVHFNIEIEITVKLQLFNKDIYSQRSFISINIESVHIHIWVTRINNTYT